jgi:uncharacterized membrane protein (DUF2068 family)
MREQVGILGWCFIIYDGLFALFAIAFFLFVSGTLMIKEPRAMIVFGPAVSILTVICVIAAAPGLVAGVGLLRLKPWARILGIVAGAMNLLSFPFGTALGVYALWLLLHKDTQPLFERPS